MEQRPPSAIAVVFGNVIFVQYIRIWVNDHRGEMMVGEMRERIKPKQSGFNSPSSCLYRVYFGLCICGWMFHRVKEGRTNGIPRGIFFLMAIHAELLSFTFTNLFPWLLILLMPEVSWKSLMDFWWRSSHDFFKKSHWEGANIFCYSLFIIFSTPSLSFEEIDFFFKQKSLKGYVSKLLQVPEGDDMI